jgi:soluble cytochrome b562
MKLLHKCLAAGLLLTGGASALYAQESKEQTPAAAAAADSVTDLKEPQSGDKDKKGKDIWLSISDVQAAAEQTTAQVTTDLSHVEQLRLAAQKGKDPVQLDCVNENLLEMKGERNLFDKKLSQISDAIALLSEEKGNEAVKQANKTGSKIHRLREAADACITSKELLFTGDSQVDWKGPTTDDPGNFDVPVEPPVYASPYS